jgi:hypothetical protein
MDQDKKIAAAIAAVTQYMQEEEAAAAQAAWAGMMPGGSAAAGVAPVAAPKPWGQNGRQTMMQMRNLMQLRTFK